MIKLVSPAISQQSYIYDFLVSKAHTHSSELCIPKSALLGWLNKYVLNNCFSIC